MKLFNLFKSTFNYSDSKPDTSYDYDNDYDEDEEDDYYEECPSCGGRMENTTGDTWVCSECGRQGEMSFGLIYFSDSDDEDYDGENISVYEAAQIWASNGKDEDYTFGYSEEELERAL